VNPGGIQPEDRQLHTSVLGLMSPAFRARASTLLASVYRDRREQSVPPDRKGGSRCGCGLVVDDPESDGVDDRYFCFLPPHPHRDLPFL
jgi:hypothetical protein